MRKPAEKQMKDLIRLMREVCQQVHDCPIQKARQPSQTDCLSCIFEDLAIMREEIAKLREFKLTTMYGTTGITKLEAAFDPKMLAVLKKQMEGKSG